MGGGDLVNSSTSNVSVDSLDDDYEDKRKRDLGYELSLDESDIRSYQWYHGPITRLAAETTVESDGDFLVRDCISSPGDFVLTCKSSGNRILHFRMNRLVLHAHTSQETVCYRFEEEAFPTIPDLISYYVSNKKPVSLLSGAVIKAPRARKVPLGHYSTSQIQKQLQKLKTNRLRQSSLCDSMSSPSPTYSKSRTPNSSSEKRSSSRTNSGRSSVKTNTTQQECLMEKYLKDVERSCLNLQANIIKQRQCILSNNLNSSSNNFIPIMNNYRTFHRTQMGKSDDMPKAHNFPKKNLSTTSLNVNSAGVGTQTSCNNFNDAHPPISLTKSPSDSSLYQPFSCFKENSFSNSNNNHSINNGTATLNRRVKKPNVVYDTLPRPRPCLSSTQIERNQFYDHPRALSRPRPKVPPPPPPQPGSINLTLRKKPLSKAEVAENSELSSTTDDNTSLLEHQELTPLLSSSTNEENEEHEANSPLPEDPFPLGLNTDVNDGSEDNKGISIGGDPLSFEDPQEETSLSASNEPVTAPVEEKECALRASSSSIEEIPMTPISLSSAFNPSEFRTLYLPKEGNKPLDPTAINAVQRTLLDTESDVLAYHLTKLDMDLLSITLNREYGLPGIKSGLHLLTLVEGKQLREDLMERCLCLKYFILTTILTATSKEQSVALMAKWISIASELSNNLVGFFNVVNALSNVKLRGITSIWRKLNENYPEDSSCLEHELKSKLKILNEGKFEEIESSETSFIVIPHIIPFLSGCKDLRGLKTFRNLFNEIFKFSKGVPIPEPFPLFNSHIAYAQECSSEKSLDRFRENGLKYINDIEIQDEILLYDLFHTNFHLKLLWGSNGAVNQSCVERISKFEKVISVLANLCSK
nr:breast cancer anti-estrogen resistance protein 3 homolog isoform X1 [Lepeophtheirus salmonis]